MSKLVEEMRSSRYLRSAVFMEFTQRYKYFETHAFCFYEGEDGKYYDSRIEKKFKKTFTFRAGNKKEVLKVFQLIKRDKQYSNVVCMFFIDKDFDDSIKDSYESLYETPCYSVENLYAQEKCLRAILRTEFSLNEDDDDFEKCISLFKSHQKKFNEYMTVFNAIMLVQKRKKKFEKTLCINDVKTVHLVEVTINDVRENCYHAKKISEMIEKLSSSKDELDNTINELSAMQECSLYFRGKNQLDFFVTIIDILKYEITNKSGFFSNDIRKPSINISNNRLSELSQYAITPSCLKDFIESHYKIFCSKNLNS